MIVYGSKTKQLLSEPISEKCPNCATPDSLQMTVSQKYAHVFWIPFFPIGKTGVTQCSHCKQVLDKKEFTEPLMRHYETMKAQTRTPIWTFSGIALLSLLIAWGIQTGKENDAENAKLIMTPMKGDIYEIKHDYKEYTLYKVDDVKGDTVMLLMSQYISNKSSGLNEIKQKGDEGYDGEMMMVFKSDLKTMLEKGEIMDIDRK